MGVETDDSEDEVKLTGTVRKSSFGRRAREMMICKSCQCGNKELRQILGKTSEVTRKRCFIAKLPSNLSCTYRGADRR